MRRCALAPVLLLAVVTACAPSGSLRASRAAGLKLEELTGVPPGLAIEDDRQWHLALFHVHTTEGHWQYRDRKNLDPRESYDAAKARMAVREAAARGIRVMFLSDHNSIDAALDKELAAYARSVGVTVVAGNEWSLGGPLGFSTGPITLGEGGPHATLVGYDVKKSKDVIAPQDTRVRPTAEMMASLVDEVHARGGAAVLSHPRAINFDWPFHSPLNFDLVEIDGPIVERSGEARELWQEWLMKGERIGAISASDWHVGQYEENVFEHVNLVRAPARSPEALTEALRGGHVMLVREPRKIPRVLLGADADGDNNFDDVREGDVMLPPLGLERARFQVRVIGARGHTLLLYGASSTDPIHRESFSEPEAVRAFSIALRPDRRTFVRAELWDVSSLRVLTNPLYFEASRPALPVPDAGVSGLEPRDDEPIRIITLPSDAGVPAGESP